MKKVYDIVTHPNDILRKKAEMFDLSKIKEKDTQELIQNMCETMVVKDGIGLAAPQIGLSTRLIVVNTKDGAIALINPEICKKSWKKQTDEEGCLSVPGVYGNVTRPYQIIVKAFDHSGKHHEIKAKGLFARVIQHEMDHLDGILFIDKAKKIKNINNEHSK